MMEAFANRYAGMLRTANRLLTGFYQADPLDAGKVVADYWITAGS